MSSPSSIMPGGGETGASPSGWTIDTLTAHLHSMIGELDKRYEQRFVAQEKAVSMALDALKAAHLPIEIKIAVIEERMSGVKSLLDAQLAAQQEATKIAMANADKATTKAETAAEKRFESMNEFREQLADQAQTFMPRRESEARHEQSGEKIAAVQSRVDRTEGRSTGVSSSWGILVGVVSVIGTVIAATIAILAFND